MVYATPVTYQYELFRGTLATASTTGVKQLRTQERDEPAEAFSVAVDRWVTTTGVEVFAGAVMHRPVVELTPGVATPNGDWSLFGYIWEPKVRALNAVLLNRQVAATAGQPMRNPLGLAILLPDGTQPNQPASGDPNGRDPWTGELTGSPQP